MSISIRQGNMNVVSSGIIHVIDNEETTITIDDQFNVTIKHIDSTKIEDQKIEIENDGEGVTIKLINFNNTLGVATSKPIGIAHNQFSTLFISLCVHSVGIVKNLSFVIYEKRN